MLAGIPALFIVAAFFVPLVLMIGQSFRVTSGSGSSWSLVSYTSVLSSGRGLMQFANTAWLSALAALLCVVLGFPLAWLISRGPSFLRGAVFIIVVSPLLISMIARTFGWLVLLSQSSFLSKWLRAIGLLSEGEGLLFSRTAIVLGLVQLSIPFAVVAIVTSLSNLEAHLENAAASLGASPIQVFFRIVVPLTRPGIAAAATISWGLSAGAYATPAILGGGKIGVAATGIYNRAVLLDDWGGGAAIAVLLVLLSLAGVVLISTLLRSRA